MWTFIGQVAVTMLSILGSLFVAFRVYQRTRTDEAGRLELVLDNDRRVREGQLSREWRGRRIDGLHKSLGECAAALQLLTGSSRGNNWPAMAKQADALRDASESLHRYIGINLFTRSHVGSVATEGSAEDIRATLGFGVSDLRNYFLAAAKAASIVAGEHGKDVGLHADLTSFAAVLWVTMYGFVEEVDSWEETGRFRNNSKLIESDYVRRVFQRVGIEPEAVGGKSDDPGETSDSSGNEPKNF